MPAPTHNWNSWFAAKEFTIRRGKDYTATQAGMTQQIRNVASRRGLSVRVVDHGESLTATILPNGPLYLGVDPGANGAMAVLLEDGTVCRVVPFADLTPTDVWNEVRRVAESGRPTAVLEKVGGYVGGQGQPGAFMFNFGASYGRIHMALVAAGIPVTEVPPQKWQKAQGVAPKGRDEKKPAFKARLRHLAQQYFPQEKVTADTADALLIARYCWSLRGSPIPTEE